MAKALLNEEYDSDSFSMNAIVPNCLGIRQVFMYKIIEFLLISVTVDSQIIYHLSVYFLLARIQETCLKQALHGVSHFAY